MSVGPWMGVPRCHRSLDGGVPECHWVPRQGRGTPEVSRAVHHGGEWPGPALSALSLRGKSCRTITFEQFKEALEELSKKRFKDKSSEEAIREVHRLIEGKAPIISGVTVSVAGRDSLGSTAHRVWGPRAEAIVPGGRLTQQPTASAPGAQARAPALSPCRKPSPRPPYLGSRTRPSSRAPTRNASTHQAGARARRAVWTWWTSRATCRATSTRAPTTRRCRGASSQPGSGPSCEACTTSHFITFLCSLVRTQDSGARAVGATPRPPPARGPARFSLTPGWGP